jgi:hypothetical protein
MTANTVAGRIYTIKQTGSGSPTISASASDQIENASSYDLGASGETYVTVVSDGVSDWWIIARG